MDNSSPELFDDCILK